MNMDDFTLSEEKLAILHQYKEVLNESDDDIARATLESLDWDLHKAIDASTTGNAPLNKNGVQVQEMDDDIEIIGTIKPADTNIFEDDMSIDSSSSIVNRRRLSRASSKTEDMIMTCSSSTAGLNANSAQPSRTSSTAAIASNSPQSMADNLSISSMDYFTSVSSIAKKSLQNRDDSGSGSTSSLVNSAPSTSNGTAVESGTTKSIPIRVINNVKSFESEDDSDDNADFNYHYSSEEETEKVPTSSAKAKGFTDQVPLIPTDFSSITEAMQNFNIVFEARYGLNYAPFYQDGIQEAAAEAFEAFGRPILERRPLVIYLHNDSSVAANIFAQNVMCSDAVSSLLKCQFILWAWDMSQQENRQKLYTWMSMSMSDVADSVKLIHKSKYPLLIILIKERGVISAHEIVEGHDTVEQTIEKLMSGLDYYLRIKNKDAADELSRLEREQIRQEQVEEYEKALAIDRARQRELQEQKERDREEEAERQRLTEEKRQYEEQLAASLPLEPAQAESNTIMIRLRFPSGTQKIRCFRMSEQLKWLITFVESMGYNMEEHRIWTSDVPKKDVATFDSSKTFMELNWPRREQVTVEEK